MTTEAFPRRGDCGRVTTACKAIRGITCSDTRDIFAATGATIITEELAPRRPIIIALGSVVTALLLVAAMGTAAFAQYPPAEDLSVACTPESPEPLDEVTCTISGGPANTDLHVVVELNPILFDETVTTDADGEAQFAFDVPEDAEPGDTITITISGDEIEGTQVLSLTIAAEEVVDDEEELPDTGAEASTLVLVGLLVAGLGVGAVVFGRRRERSRTQA